MAKSEEENLINNISVGDEFERYKEQNPFEYTPLELSKRKKAIRDASKDYPNIPEKYIEWFYDMTEKVYKKEEIDEIINTKAWEVPGMKRQFGGVLKTGEIIEPENKESVSLESIEE